MSRFLCVLLIVLSPLGFSNPDGATIYKDHCASCHGDQGQGVVGEYDEALVGKRSIESLTRIIHKTMPEDDEDSVIDEDARAVAEYIHRQFYSPEAQALRSPVRKDLLHRTQHQHRNAVASLVSHFRGERPISEKRGLFTKYFNAEKMNKTKHRLIERLDPQPVFDLGQNHGVEKINPRAFSIYWSGGLLVPETGTYQFSITTTNGARLYLNTYNEKTTPLIDAWVSSGNKSRTTTAKAFLLGGHPVPLRIDYTSYQENVSQIRVEWKKPHGTWEIIPERYLCPDNLREVAIVTTPFPPDDASLGYERGASVTKAWTDAVANAAIEATSIIMENLDRLSRSDPKKPDHRKKLEAFVLEFATHAYTRPLDDAQKNNLLAFFQKNNPTDATQLALMRILTSPKFLYPALSHLGKNDDYARAAHIALSLADSLPDKRLHTAAAQGKLSQPAHLRAHIHRLLPDPRTKHKIHRFFYHWLHLSEKEDLTKDPKLFPGFDASLIADLRTSFDLFLEETVWSTASDYRQLFLSKNLHLNPQLARFYQVPEPPPNSFKSLPATDGQRAGILTHPYLLTAFSYHRQTSPIHRGVYLSRNVLGRFLKPPPEATAFKDADFNPNLTMREKVTELTKEASCMSCHEIINPVGFSLENFDAVGRFRLKEKNKQIDTTSDYPTEDDKMIKISGPRDLAKLAVESPGAHRAFIKHLFHHLIQQPTAAYGYQTMDQLHDEFQKNQFNIQKLIESICLQTAPNTAKQEK